MDMPIGDDGGPWVKVMFFVPFDFFNRNPVRRNVGIVSFYSKKYRTIYYNEEFDPGSG